MHLFFSFLFPVAVFLTPLKQFWQNLKSDISHCDFQNYTDCHKREITLKLKTGTTTQTTYIDITFVKNMRNFFLFCLSSTLPSLSKCLKAEISYFYPPGTFSFQSFSIFKSSVSNFSVVILLWCQQAAVPRLHQAEHACWFLLGSPLSCWNEQPDYIMSDDAAYLLSLSHLSFTAFGKFERLRWDLRGPFRRTVPLINHTALANLCILPHSKKSRIIRSKLQARGSPISLRNGWFYALLNLVYSLWLD